MGDYSAGIIIIVLLLVGIAVFIICRELVNWYWKINERIRLQNKTNFLLERISVQLGASSADEVTVEQISTGQKKRMNLDDFIALKMNSKNSKDYRIIKDDISGT